MEGDPEGPEVDADAVGRPEQLRRHVLRGAALLAPPQRRAAVRGRRQPEVGEFEEVAAAAPRRGLGQPLARHRQQDVFRLDVAVGDAVAVEVGERERGALGDGGGEGLANYALIIR